ncbi:MAG TPA: alpha/beta hydrolase [Phycisphaerae bacterium]|nr:alpha/beta hydrolase [Phycisphaerae bacterium]
MKTRGYVSSLALPLFVAAATAAFEPPVTSRPAEPRPDMHARTAAGSRIARDIAYVEKAHPQQKLDIYAPAQAKDAPVVVFVHGGEWTKGDKSEVSFKPEFLNNNGIVFVSVNYRLSGTAKHPAQVEDIACAMRWIRDHIHEYGGAPSRLILMGHSAGCHLVTLLGLDPRPLARQGLKPADLAGVVSWSGGAFDLVEKVKSGGMYADYIKINFGPDEKTWRDASPMNHIADTRPLPKFLFASAGAHKPESRLASEKMAAMIREVGGDATTILLEGKSHTNANHELGMPGDKTGRQLLDFIGAAINNRPLTPQKNPTS